MEEAASSDSFGINFVSGDQQVDHRIGDEYQAKIPPMISKSEPAKLSLNSMALSIPIMWIKDEDGVQGSEDNEVDMNESLKSIKARHSRYCTKNKSPKPENINMSPERSKRSKSLNFEPSESGSLKNYHPVPGSSSCSWKEAEVDSFLLGLYIFGKNFVQVNKLLENKVMGDLLAFYFGKFYNTNKYHKWSESRKPGRRKCVSGRKLFLGWRQHELLSRLIPGVSQETQKNRLLEVSKSFAEGNVSLEKYILTLKEMVGVSVLVDAVAIGKGKEDLTSLAVAPAKTKQWFTVSSNKPSAKAYANLASSEIVKQLTDGSRLSKARCKDMFWGAVWPRLLAKGWHSEQPKSERSYVTSKDYLVFLVPGVKKFSRSKLVKGDHYFDSVSDILTKVASEPELLELESREIKAVGFDSENSSYQSDQDSSCDSRSRHHYLRSPSSICNSLHMKFPVVDTSSTAIGGKFCALRELKLAATDSHFSSKISNRIENGRSVYGDLAKRKIQKKFEDSEEELSCPDPDSQMRFSVVDTSLEQGGKASRLRKLRHLPVDLSPQIDRSSTESHEINENVKLQAGEQDISEPDGGKDRSINGVGLDSGTTKKKLEKQRYQKTDASNDGRPKRVIKHKFTRTEDIDNSVKNSPSLKRRSLSACVKKELSRLNEKSLKLKRNQTRHYPPPNTHEANNSVHLQDSSVCQEITMSLNGNPDEGRNIIAEEDDSFDIKANEVNTGERKTQLSIDLNLIPDEANDSKNADLDNQLDHIELKSTTGDVGSTEQQDNLNKIPRRQSSRKRPLTTRVLEALEMGLFTSKKPKSSKPRKPQRTLGNPAKEALSKVRVIPERVTEAENGEDKGFLVDKVKICKPCDQMEYEELKRPPNMLKLSLKRN